MDLECVFVRLPLKMDTNAASAMAVLDCISVLAKCPDCHAVECISVQTETKCSHVCLVAFKSNETSGVLSISNQQRQ